MAEAAAPGDAPAVRREPSSPQSPLDLEAPLRPRRCRSQVLSESPHSRQDHQLLSPASFGASAATRRDNCGSGRMGCQDGVVCAPRWRCLRPMMLLAAPLLAIGVLVQHVAPAGVRGQASRWWRGAGFSRLFALRSIEPEDIPATETECGFDLLDGILYLPRAALEITDATLSCPEVKKLQREADTGYAESKAKIAKLIFTNFLGGRPPSEEEVAALGGSQYYKVIKSLYGRRLSNASRPTSRISRSLSPEQRRQASRQAHNLTDQLVADSKALLKQVRRDRRERFRRLKEMRRSRGDRTGMPLDAAFDAWKLAQAKQTPRLHKRGLEEAGGSENAQGKKSALDKEEDEAEGSGVRKSGWMPRQMVEEDLEEEDENDDWREIFLLYQEATMNRRAAVATRRVCAAEISGAVASLSFSATFLSSAASECKLEFNQEEYCASDIARLLGSVAELAAGASATAAECTDYVRYLRNAAGEYNRRLQATPGDQEVDGTPGAAMTSAAATAIASAAASAAPLATAASTTKAAKDRSLVGEEPGNLTTTAEPDEPKESIKEIFDKLQEAGEKMQERQKEQMDRQIEIAECVVDTAQATTFLGKLALDINAAVVNCEAHRPENCAQGILAAIDSAALVSMMVSNSVTECPGRDNTRAFCTSAISQMLAGISGLGAALAGVADVCRAEDVYY